MKEFALAILLLLTVLSCANKTTPLPIPVSCFKSEQLPAPVESAAIGLTINSADGEKIQAVLIEREQLRKSDDIFRALFGGCSL